MKNIKLLLGTLAVSSLLLVGCGKNEAVKAAEEWADAVCKCKDADCAMKASVEGNEKMQKFRDAKGTKEDAEKIMAAGKKVQECLQKTMSAGVPEAPAAPAPAAPAPAPAPAPETK